MAVGICPLAADVGNLADWVGVLVGGLAAGGTIWIAWLARKTSERATQIAHEAREIAQQQHAEAIQLRTGTARILGSLLGLEVMTIPIKLGVVLKKLDAVLRVWPDEHKYVTELEWILNELTTTFLPTTEQAQDRLHNLPDDHGDAIARLAAMATGLAVSSRRLQSRLARIPMPVGQPVVIGYGGPVEDLHALREQVKSTLRDAVYSARRFAVFVGAEDPDYSGEEALLQVNRTG
ncbi:hypothetical protein VC253_01305 [Xanthomonas campestris]|uniref:hypothetical protein n=1 Tax=Xanthomonas campestris TaxID=339 RepID=UPI002B23DB63|nr:hypothetical protein [Xanthomonas campestris]MEA9550499.1 hypothetical protein [Xanthomonas campestris]